MYEIVVATLFVYVLLSERGLEGPATFKTLCDVRVRFCFFLVINHDLEMHT